MSTRTPLPPGASLALHFPDSEVASVRRDGDALVLRFAAAATELCTAEGAPVQAGYSLGLWLRLAGAEVLDEEPPTFGRLHEGRLVADPIPVDAAGSPADAGGAASPGSAPPRALPGALPVGPRLDGPLRLELAFANRARLVARGRHAQLGFDGAPNFDDSLQC